MAGLEWDRQIEVPVYHCIAADEIEPWVSQEPDALGNAFVGRVVTWLHARALHEPGPGNRIGNPEIPMPAESVANLTRNDVVYIPLFNGYDPTLATGVDDRLPEPVYGENFARMKELAERGTYLLLGNAGPETAFCCYPGKLVMAPKTKWADLRKDLVKDWKKKKAKGEEPTPVEGLPSVTDEDVDCDTKYWRHGPTVLEEQIRFMRDCHQVVSEVGGRLAFSPNAMEFALDLYFCQGRLRREFLRTGALLVQFLGFVEWQRTDRPTMWPSPYGGLFNPLLSGYLRGINAMVGMEFKKGLAAGNDRKAKEHGYDAGFIGWV